MTDTTLNTVDMLQIGKRAKQASRLLATATTEQKNQALLAMADALTVHADAILEANRQDLADAEANGLTPALLDRLDLQKRLDGIIADVRKVATLPDPVGRILEERVLENGLQVQRRAIPLGVLGVIYEARPNVTVDVAVLALKSGNASILRGGKETLRSNIALVNVLQGALVANGLPAEAIQYIESTDRRYVKELLTLNQYVDVIIPRGGNALHKLCVEEGTIPVITGGLGICHIFVDESADLTPALEIIHNAKTQRPSVCNAMETLLVHQAIAADFLPRVVERLAGDGVEYRAEQRAYQIMKDHSLSVQLAGEGDFDQEWLALILSVKVVDGLDQAIDHIQQHSTNHSDSILTHHAEHAERFLNEIDSAAVYVNASTRFTDGGALGLGAEVAVSTQKLHARGPMALEELNTYKWIIRGDNHIRA